MFQSTKVTASTTTANRQAAAPTQHYPTQAEIAYAASLHLNALQRKGYRASQGLILPSFKHFFFFLCLLGGGYMYSVYYPQVDVEKSKTVKAGVGMGWKSLLSSEEPSKASQNPLAATASKGRRNEYAPVASGAMTAAEVQQYLEKFGKIAVAEMDKFGVPASISLAQGLIESRAGTSRLARNNNNHFGIKCFSKKCRKGHCTNHFDDHHKDFFRSFAGAWESWRAHSQLLTNAHYSGLKRHGNNYTAWAKGLRRLGYATDPNYDTKLIRVIEQYNLTQFDKI